jgi:hypothetical protein
MGFSSVGTVLARTLAVNCAASTAASMNRFMKAAVERWTRVVNNGNIKPD